MELQSMKIYVAKSHDGQFVARISAEDEEDAIAVLAQSLEGTAYSGGAKVMHLAAAVLSLIAEGQQAEGFTRRSVVMTEDTRDRDRYDVKDKMCAYCGIRPSTTGEADHVIAQAWFDEINRTNDVVYIRVPACETCNGKKSKDEQYLVPLVAGCAGPAHPQTTGLYGVQGPLHRSAEKTPNLWKKYGNASTSVWAYDSSSGLVLPTVEIELEQDRWQNLFCMIARGLFYWHNRSNFPSQIALMAHSVPHHYFVSLWPTFANSGKVENLGDGVFRGAMWQDPADSSKFVHLYVFYNAYEVVVRSFDPSTA
jgi:hypothetical protein